MDLQEGERRGSTPLGGSISLLPSSSSAFHPQRLPHPTPAHRSPNSSKAPLCSRPWSKKLGKLSPSYHPGLSQGFENSRLRIYRHSAARAVSTPSGEAARHPRPAAWAGLSAPQGRLAHRPPRLEVTGPRGLRGPRTCAWAACPAPRGGPRTPARGAPAAWALAGPPPKREGVRAAPGRSALVSPRRPGAGSRVARLRCARWARPGRSPRARPPQSPSPAAPSPSLTPPSSPHCR